MDLKSLYLSELSNLAADLGEKKFRAKQLYDWIHKKHIKSLDEAGNIPKTLREKLSEEADFTDLKEMKLQRSTVDGTEKFLFGCSDGCLVESVMMPYSFGNSVCVSSQVGCAMGCTFCASTLDGVKRNLSTAEMLDQVYKICRSVYEDRKKGGKEAFSRKDMPEVSRIVVMGMGEPFHNYENIKRFIYIMSDENGMNMSRRHITVSTCGIVPRIYDTVKDFPQVNLALSLHSAIQEKRESIMPIAKEYNLKELIKACKYHVEKTGRRITFEYAMMHGINDLEEDIRAIKGLVKNIPCVVNLIPVNPVVSKSFVEPSGTDVLDFKLNLEKSGINVTIRREMGRDIDGACGQLVRRYAV